MRWFFATPLLLGALAAAAQQIGQNVPPGGSRTATIAISTQLVVETVVVKDKKGNPIPGLAAKDFTVTENGVPQSINFCEHQLLPKTPSAGPSARSESQDIKVYYRLGRTRISPETPGKLRYQDRRLLVLYFDMTDCHAARGPTARSQCGAEVHQDTDDVGRSRFYPAVFGRRS